MKICGCKGCEKSVLALGMCSKHWRRTKLFGSPFAVMSRSGILRGLPLLERFERQHRKADSGCWQWTGTVDPDGYGRIAGTHEGVVFKKAHRLAWVLHNKRQIPEGMVVCHSCDNPRCVNPEHLWLGSASENQLDKIAKGRQYTPRKGEESTRAKLTEAQVREILADPRPHSEIAEQYGIKFSTVSSIKTRQSWGHLDVDHIVKGKRASGRRGHGMKITEEIVREIKASSESGSVLAERYGVSRGLICNILKGRSWAHVSLKE